jgi:hypothetical protein
LLNPTFFGNYSILLRSEAIALFGLKALLRSFFNDFLQDGKSGEDVWPAGVEGEMGESFACLLLCESVTHSAVEVG